MERITGTDAANLIEAYNSVYAPQEEVELTEEQVQEDFENWVNSLVEEGHDLSEYTWEDMYNAYLEEAIGQPGSAGMVDYKNQAGQVKSAYKSSSDGKLYKNYNDALAAKNSRMRGLAVQQGLNRTYRAGGGNAAVAQGRSPFDVMKQGATNLRAQQRPATPAPAPAARPVAQAARPVVQAAKPTTPAPTAGTSPTLGYTLAQKGIDLSKSSASTTSATPVKRPSLAQQAAELRAMQAASRQRQGLTQGFDVFDVIKGHLLDEGYADSEEAAFTIMANMSEEWKQSILEGMLDFLPKSKTVTVPADKMDKRNPLQKAVDATKPLYAALPKTKTVVPVKQARSREFTNPPS